MTFDFEACSLYVAMQAPARAKNQHTAGGHVSSDRTLDFDLSGMDVAFDASSGADDDRPIRCEIAAKLAIDSKVAAQSEGSFEDCACIEECARTGLGWL